MADETTTAAPASKPVETQTISKETFNNLCDARYELDSVMSKVKKIWEEHGDPDDRSLGEIIHSHLFFSGNKKEASAKLLKALSEVFGDENGFHFDQLLPADKAEVAKVITTQLLPALFA